MSELKRFTPEEIEKLRQAELNRCAGAVTIAPGDYVAVSDITSEAVHAAVVECFKAAGGTASRSTGVYNQYYPETLGLGWDDQRSIMWLKTSAKRQLTLQQLFTATNSISWPAWAVDIRLCGNKIWFYGGAGKHQIIIGDPNAVVAPNVPLILAIREDYSTVRPAPETGWFDWSAGKPRELPPVGTVCDYHKVTGDYIACLVLATNGKNAWIKIANGQYYTVDDARFFRPANYTERKADLERDRTIKAAENIIKTTSSAIDNVALTALYDAGLLRESR